MSGRGPRYARLGGLALISPKAQQREAEAWQEDASKVYEGRLKLGGRRPRRSTKKG